MRVRAVAGDVQEKNCGVGELDGLDVHQFWHSAASLRFEDRYSDEIFAINRDGAQQALPLAARLKVDAFNYMSTAYVGGASEGTVLEQASSVDKTNNLYEQSKVAAEELVASQPGMGIRIFRPSIVVGHSRTYAATNFTGMYGFLRKLYGFHGMMARTQEALLRSTELQIKATGSVPLNIVPIDSVVGEAVTLMLTAPAAPGEPAYYHLTNPTPPLVGDVLNLMFGLLSMSEPRLVDGPDDFTWLDEKFNGRIDFYRSYLRGHKVFDRTHTDAYLEPGIPDAYRMQRDDVHAYCDWYLTRLHKERAQLPGQR